MKATLVDQFFGDVRELSSRGFSENAKNTAVMSGGGGGCQCVSCQNTGCNK